MSDPGSRTRNRSPLARTHRRPPISIRDALASTLTILVQRYPAGEPELGDASGAIEAPDAVNPGAPYQAPPVGRRGERVKVQSPFWSSRPARSDRG